MTAAHDNEHYEGHGNGYHGDHAYMHHDSNETARDSQYHEGHDDDRANGHDSCDADAVLTSLGTTREALTECADMHDMGLKVQWPRGTNRVVAERLLKNDTTQSSTRPDATDRNFLVAPIIGNIETKIRCSDPSGPSSSPGPENLVVKRAEEIVDPPKAARAV